MIGVLTHHWAKPDKIEEAKALLDGNGLAQSKALGYGQRLTFISQDDPTKISTLVTWDSNEIYDAAITKHHLCPVVCRLTDRALLKQFGDEIVDQDFVL